MVKKSADNSAPAIAPFLTKCYDMVDDRSTDEVISWSYNGNSFVIWDMTRFTVQLLPKFFKHGNFSSFMRQLNIYGFRKTDSDRWEFANDGFIRDQKNLLKNIIRRKHSQGLSQNQSTPQIEKTGKVCDEDETNVLWKEVESLNTDKNALMQELSKLRQVHETTENKVLLLRERLQGMEKNQQQMLSFLVMAMQSPGFLVQFLQPKENTWRMPESGKKTMLREVIGDDSESTESDGMIVRFQPSMETDETSMSIKSPPSESSSDKAKDFFMNIDFLKMPMDEHFFAPENHGPLSLPDLAEDNILKQFLLASRFLENSIDANPEDSAVFGTQLEKFQTIESLTEEMEKSEDWESRERSQSLDLLTEQLGLLISEGSG